MRSPEFVSYVRTALLAVFASWFLCGTAENLLSHPATAHQPNANSLNARSGAALRELVEKWGFVLEARDQQTLRAAAQDLMNADWYAHPTNSALVEISASIAQMALVRAERVLESWEVERSRPLPFSNVVQRDWPSGSGVCIFRIATGQAGDGTPAVLKAEIDFARPAERFEVAMPEAPVVYVLVWGRNARENAAPLKLDFLSDGKVVAASTLQIHVRASGNVQLEVLDALSRRPTAAVVGVYARDHQLVPSTNSLALDFWQNGGSAIRTRPYNTCRWWPGSSWEREVCFVDGNYSAVVPAGEYKVVVAKGPEYEPIVREIRVQAGKISNLTVELRHWIDMPARGWISGDTHVHFSRQTAAASAPLLAWIAAEDVHVGNILRMGDANQTYFEQFAFGPEGRTSRGGYWLVPGQEDPRTDELGHAMGLNLLAPIHLADQYHLYDLTFDQIHAQGGLAGYAHVYQPPRPAFWVRRDMTLNIPKRKIDFLEISEFGDADDRLYSEFLNLGFRLSATGGSDVPWGESVGISRTYAWTAGRTNPDAWFEAVEKGRTFVTAGPMLFLEVNGQLPGAELTLRRGDTLRIEAQARSPMTHPRYLEIVSQGRVIAASASTDENGREHGISLNAEVKVEHSTWITARCAGAITSPVYVRVDGAPWWDKEMVPALVAVRLSQLDEIATFAEAVEQGQSAGYDHPERLRAQMPALRERVASARAYYRKILLECEAKKNALQ